MRTKSPFAFMLSLLTFCAISITTNAQQLRDAFRQVNQSVVIVRTKRVEVAPSADESMAIIDGLGSGVLISNDGKVLTAAHVVQTADVASVEFSDGQEISARVIGSDVQSDVALLQLKEMPKGVTPARLGDSDKVEVGDQIFVIGAPYGISQTLSVGHLSGRHRLNSNNDGETSVEFLQTDAAINTGNSGGPMFDMQGNVIGIVSSIMSHSGGSEGLAFATAANTAKQLLLERKPFWSGIDGLVVTGALAKAINLPQAAGVLVQRIGDGSIGSHLGINPGTLRVTIQGTDLLLGGDVILSVNNIPVIDPSSAQSLGNLTSDENYERIYNSVATLKPGDPLVVTVFREGKVLKLTTSIDR
ncbi:MAG TPA: trypsin-like peptidase domain-containing protein [Pyrinomonadaceae bacterium]|nr:trypsin-like peptidase domain-containing protein [Pyrinomonadaceae bacterium]